MKTLNNLKAFVDYSQTIDYFYEIDVYENPTKKRQRREKYIIQQRREKD